MHWVRFSEQLINHLTAALVQRAHCRFLKMPSQTETRRPSQGLVVAISFNECCVTLHPSHLSHPHSGEFDSLQTDTYYYLYRIFQNICS